MRERERERIDQSLAVESTIVPFSDMRTRGFNGTKIPNETQKRENGPNCESGMLAMYPAWNGGKIDNGPGVVNKREFYCIGCGINERMLTFSKH